MKEYLVNELYLTDRVLFEKYNKRVYLIKDMIYYNNGLFVDECLYDSGRLSIVYSDTIEKKRYVDNSGVVNLSPIEAEVELEWKKGDEIVDRKKIGIYVDYFSPKTEFINEFTNTGADLLRIRVWFEKHLMCNYCFRI